LLAAALVAGAAACGDDSGDRSGPGGAAAVASAEAYVAARGVDVKEGTQFVRSTRDPDWALVLGGGGRRTIWAVWLHAEGTRWRPVHVSVNGRGDTTPADVPCDIKPPYSEPECPPQ
jgi:hypothetical protein